MAEIFHRDRRRARSGIVEQHVETTEGLLDGGEERFTDAGSVTSVATASARLPPLPSLIAASSASLRRPAKTTEYPSFKRASAVALPMPLPAPVTIATLSPLASIRSPPDLKSLSCSR